MTGKPISKELENVINDRKNISAVKDEKDFISLTKDGQDSFGAEVIYTIISEGDAIGAVIIAGKDEKIRMTEVEQKLAAAAASFLGRQLEQ